MVADELIGTAGDPPASAGGSPALATYLTLATATAFMVTLIWGLTGAGYFWPRWVWFGLGSRRRSGSRSVGCDASATAPRGGWQLSPPLPGC